MGAQEINNKWLIMTTDFEISPSPHGGSEEKIVYNLTLKRREGFMEEEGAV